MTKQASISPEKKAVTKVTLYKLEPSFQSANLADYQLRYKAKRSSWNVAVYIRSKTNQLPAWRPLVSGVVENKHIPRNSYSSLIVLFTKGTHRFALTAGYGYVDVQRDAIQDYGILIARKTLDPNELDYLYQKVPTGNVYGLIRSLRGRYIPSSDQINDRSVLKALRGKVLDSKLGISLEGRTSLALTGKKTFDDVIDLIEGLTRIERSKSNSVEIGGLTEATKETSEVLTNNLKSQIAEGKYDGMLLSANEEIMSGQFATLRVGGDSEEYTPDRFEELLISACKQDPTEPSALVVRAFDDAKQEVDKKKLIELIEGELDYQGQKYFRIDRKWYLTNPDYRDKVERDFREVIQFQNGYFKQWPRKGVKYDDEDVFLNASTKRHIVLAHTKKINTIEFADLIDVKKNFLIHVKRGKGAYLRNLFAQGWVSASLFHADTSFKELASKKFGVKKNGKYTIIFAICPEGEKKIDSIFTLFAKVDFLERYDSLRSMGYEVRYALLY